MGDNEAISDLLEAVPVNVESVVNERRDRRHYADTQSSKEFSAVPVASQVGEMRLWFHLGQK